MNFSELRSTLVAAGRDPREIYFAKYDGTQSAAGFRDPWIIWEHDGLFDVGGEERGRFVVTERFASEDEACGYLLKALSRRSHVTESPDESA